MKIVLQRWRGERGGSVYAKKVVLTASVQFGRRKFWQKILIATFFIIISSKYILRDNDK